MGKTMFPVVGFNVIAKQKEEKINILKNIYQISSNEELENYHKHIQRKYPQYFIQDFLTTNINSDFKIDNRLRYKILKVFLNSNVRKLRISGFETEYHKHLLYLILEQNLSNLRWFDVQGINFEVPSLQEIFLSIINNNTKLQNLMMTNASGNILTKIFTTCPKIESLLIGNACFLCGLELETIRSWPVHKSLNELSTLYYQRCDNPNPENAREFLSKFPYLLKFQGFSHIVDNLRAFPDTTNLTFISDYASTRQIMDVIRSKCPYLSILELINPEPCALFHLSSITGLSGLYIENFSAYYFYEALNLVGEKLETLELRGSDRTLDLYRVMNSCPNLTYIEIHGTDIKYDNFEEVVYPKLKTLIIHMNGDQTEPLLNIFEHFPNIQHLELLNWDHLIDSDISLCSQYWTNLKFINISNANLTLSVVNYLIKCPKIKHIHGLITWNSTFLDDIDNVIKFNRKCCFHCNKRTF